MEVKHKEITMKLVVTGQINTYDVEIHQGSYRITNRTIIQPEIQAFGLPSNKMAEKMAIDAIDAMDGPVEVYRQHAA